MKRCNDNSFSQKFMGAKRFLVLIILFCLINVSALDLIKITSPENASNLISSDLFLNSTIKLNNTLNNMKLSFNQTNFTFYNSSLLLMLNFDNNSLLGENNTYMIDNSIYSNNATESTSKRLPFLSIGKYGYGIKINSSVYPFKTINYITNINKQVRIEFWFKSSVSGGNSKILFEYFSSANYYDGGQNSFSMDYDDNSASVDGAICVGQNNGEGISGLNFQCSLENIGDGEYHYITIILDRTKVNYLNQTQIYIDSEKKELETIGNYNASAYNLNFGEYPFYIGGRKDTPSPIGSDYILDSLRIWNTTSSRENINKSYLSNLRKDTLNSWEFILNQSMASNNLTLGIYEFFVEVIDNVENIFKSNTTQIEILEQKTPLFSNLNDNQEQSSLTNISNFNCTIENSNGTVFLNINSKNISAYLYGGVYFVNTTLETKGIYPYYWFTYSNDSFLNLTFSETQNYINNMTSLFNYSDENSLCIGDIGSYQWKMEYLSDGYVPEIINNYIYNETFGYLDYINPQANSGQYGLLNYRIIMPNNASNLNFSVPMKLPPGVENSNVSLFIYNTSSDNSPDEILNQTTAELTSEIKYYSVFVKDLEPNEEYLLGIGVNTIGSSIQAKALVGSASCSINSNYFVFNSSYKRLEISNDTVLNDVDNILKKNYPETSEFGRYAFNTNATEIVLEIVSNIVTYPSLASIGVKINGENYVGVEANSTSGNLLDYYISLPKGDKYIELINGEQSLVNLNPPKQGTWVRTIYVPSNSYIIYNNSLKENKLVIYGDSITGGGTIEVPSFNAWTSLFRNYTDYDLSVYAYGYRNLKYDFDNEGISKMVSNIGKSNPNYVYLAIGTNDYALNTQNASDFGDEYGEFLDAIHSSIPDAIIFAQSPLNRSSEGVNSKGSTLKDYRDEIKNLSDDRSYVIFIDGRDILSLSDLADGVHPTLEGNLKYFNYVYNFMNNPPNLTLISPPGDYSKTSSSSTINFMFNVFSESNFISSCSVFLDGIEYANNSLISELNVNSIEISSIGIGSHSWYISCSDFLGNNINSSNRVFTISSLVTTSGSLTIYNPSLEQIQKGYEKTLRKNQRISFEFENETHFLKLDKVFEDNVTITISSEVQTFNITINQTKKINLNNDSYYDLQVFLKDVRGIYVDLVVQTIHKEVPEVIKDSIVDEEEILNKTGLWESVKNFFKKIFDWIIFWR